MNIQQLGILDTTVIIPAITTMTNIGSQTVILTAITTTYLIIKSGLSLIKLLLILLTHGGTDTNWALIHGRGYR